MNIVYLIIEIITGLTIAIPLVLKLIEYVKKAQREKNWQDVIKLVISLMKVAETKFETGADRKEWVMMSIKASADTIEYDIDMDRISKLIDDLCEMAKIVNAEIKEATAE